MVTMSATVSGADVKAFDAALGLLQESLGSMSAQAPRRAAIQICKSLRAGTKVAKQKKNITQTISSATPQWITYKNGRKLDKPLRRWRVTLIDRGRTIEKYVYAGTVDEMKKQIREQVGTNYYPISSKANGPKKRGGVRGLAKQSWGWVMHNIFRGAAPDTPWHRRKNDRRNPKDTASESYSRASEGILKSHGEALISNRLDYIADALKISLDTAVNKAASAIVKCIATKRIRGENLGMSSAQIREAAEIAKRDFLGEFKI